MKKLITICSLVVALIGVVTFNAEAIPITGDVSFDGGYAINSTNLGIATAFTSFTGVEVSSTGGGTGDFASLAPGTAMTMSGFTFSPFSGTPQWWEVTLGTTTYSFDLTSLTILFQSSSVLAMEGAGIAHITGLDDTIGTWILTANQLRSTFSYSGSSGATPVPEPGILILLGISMMSVAGLKRWWKD